MLVGKKRRKETDEKEGNKSSYLYSRDYSRPFLSWAVIIGSVDSSKLQVGVFTVSGGFEAFDSPSTIHTHVRWAFILRRAPPSHSLVVYYDVDYYVVETLQELDKRNNCN